MNNPKRIQFTNGNVTEYVYSADGEKLRTIHLTGVNNITVPIDKTLPLTVANTLCTDYIGPFIFENNKPDKVLFSGGFCSFTDSNQPVFHYYTQNHLRNNRAVVNENGTTKQVAHYYPFDGVNGDEGLNASAQPYKYNGKELDRTNGLSLYDYGARNYDAASTRWMTVDPLCWKNYNISPYVYCGNNPVRFIDPDGKIVKMYVETEGLGHSFISVGDGKNTIVYTYGRYLSGDKDKSSGRETDPTGRGVMVRLTGEKALNFIKYEETKYKASGYKIFGTNEKLVQKEADKMFDSGRELTKTEYSTDANNQILNEPSDAKVIDKYNLLDNNCTTKSINLVKSGGTKLDFNYIIQGHHGEYINIPIFVPVYLQIYLDSKLKK